MQLVLSGNRILSHSGQGTKNNITYPFISTTKTVNGVTYTDNGDGSITVDGSPSGYSDFGICSIEEKGEYTLTGLPANNNLLYEVSIKYKSGTETATITSDKTIQINTSDYLRFSWFTIKVKRNANGVRINSVVVKPYLTKDKSFVSMGGTVICEQDGKSYQNATVAECEGYPSDIDTVGYEYHAGVFVPCAPYGEGEGNVLVACQNDSGTPKDSGLKSSNLLLQDYAAASYLPGGYGWAHLVYGKDKFLAIGAPGTSSTALAYSYDGINWASSTIPTSCSVIGYGNDMFVALPANGTKAAYSTDGVNWNTTTIPAGKWSDVRSGARKFVAEETSGEKEGAYSTDGINWTVLNLPYNTDRYWSSIDYYNGIFVIVSKYDDSRITNATAGYSEDGITWSTSSMGAVYTCADITHGNGKFVAVDSDGTHIYYSANGETWNSVIIATGSIGRVNARVAYGAGKFVVVAGNDQIAYSTNGATWSLTTAAGDVDCDVVTYGGDKFIILTAGSDKATYSYDGVNFTRGKFEFIVPDGTNVTELIAQTLVDYYGIAYQEGVNNA